MFDLWLGKSLLEKGMATHSSILFIIFDICEIFSNDFS